MHVWTSCAAYNFIACYFMACAHLCIVYCSIACSTRVQPADVSSICVEGVVTSQMQTVYTSTTAACCPASVPQCTSAGLKPWKVQLSAKQAASCCRHNSVACSSALCVTSHKERLGNAAGQLCKAWYRRRERSTVLDVLPSMYCHA